jgi:ATP-dependent DNA helicase MPH1
MAQLLKDDNFKKCMQQCKNLIFEHGGKRECKDFLGHEKLQHVVDIMTTFFEENPNSRAIIFAEFRESAAEIIRVLEAWCPTRVRAHLFIGQAASSKSSGGSSTARTGMRQKMQQHVVEAFKSGAVNTLVATSIGEEGLDIGQVDLIICYDQSKSPIRGLQRMGRTGRQRQGNIYMLMTKKEENKLEHALNGYRYIQNKINQDNNFTYASRVRILPADVSPAYVERVIEIPDENKEVLAHEDIISQLENQSQAPRSTPRSRKRCQLHACQSCMSRRTT